MPRGTTLAECLEMLRFELGHSPSRALGKNVEPSLRHLLRRTQTLLWTDYYWPFLEVERAVTLQAGEHHYAFPADLDGTRVRFAHVRWNSEWVPVCYGIGNAQYNDQDPYKNDRNMPVERWDWKKNYLGEAEQVSGQMFEVWPLPSINGDPANGISEGMFKLTGIRKLRPFIADAHVCDLDDYLIVIYAAAKLLGRQKLADGQEAAAAASNYYSRLKGQQSKAPMFILAGETGDAESEHEVRVTYARAP